VGVGLKRKRNMSFNFHVIL